MNNRDEKSMILLWRLVTVIIGLVWIISFLVRIFVLSDWSLEQGLMSRNVYIGFCVLTALMLIALMIVPFQFYIHAAFCWLWSMARLIDGGVTNALLIHFLSYIFLYRQGFFNTHHRIKLIIGGCLLAAAIASQIRFGYIILSQQLIRLFENGIFQRLQLADRVNFLSHYATHRIVREEKNN